MRNKILFLLFLMLIFTSCSLAENLVVNKGGGKLPLVALTFDDGPKPEFTERLLGVLDLYNIKATFFVTGKETEEFPDIIYRMADSGHEVANHSYSHVNFSTLTHSRMREEIGKTNDVVSDITGIRPKYFRPPGGNFKDGITDILKAEGMTLIRWDVNASDYFVETDEFEIDSDYNDMAKDLIMRVPKNSKNGSIILFHNGSPQTIKALPAIIGELRSRGFTFVTISELLDPEENY